MTVNEREKKCEDRIEEQQASRMDSLRALFKAYDGQEPLTPDELQYVVNLHEPDFEHYDADSNTYDGDDLEELAREHLQEFGYGVSLVKTYRHVWSGGGPADYLEVDCDEEGDLLAARYLFQDWFDGATRELHGDELELAERYHDQTGAAEYLESRQGGW